MQTMDKERNSTQLLVHQNDSLNAQVDRLNKRSDLLRSKLEQYEAERAGLLER